ncbi:MAG: sigma-54 dependent transcriptional regulator [Pseudomonadota bacterium]
MIEVIADCESVEGQRLHQGLIAQGFSAELVASHSDEYECVLTKVEHLRSHPELPGLGSVVVFGGEDTAEAAKEALALGATDYFPEGASVERVLASLSDDPQPQEKSRTLTPARAGESLNPQMQRVYAMSERVAKADIAVLISGPSGAGKEVIAKHIHACSGRANGPYVAINCAAIPETILEATLFGHTKGAYTGASEARQGKFELAAGGTLLLDEITEMPIALQSKLLRVLQEREVERIGSNMPTEVDVRVIAATNRDPQQAVAEGLLREDLYYRLSVFPLVVPRLIERAEDILPLAQTFLLKYGGTDLVFSPEAQHSLISHNWPGNVRELENCVQRALVLCDEAEIQVEHLALPVSNPQALEITKSDLANQVESREEEILLQSLAANNGVRKRTAAQLGISERTLRYKLSKMRARGVID